MTVADGSWRSPFHLAGRARYRVRQFMRGLRPSLTPAEIVEVRQRLTAPEFALFLVAGSRDRRHSVALYQLLQSEGVEGAPPPDVLLVAALLHDVGKGSLRVWDRVLFVILGALPARLTGWVAVPVEQQPGGVRWRDAQWRLRHHAELGAQLLERAGSAPRVVELVRRHTGSPAVDDVELAAFIRADGRT